MLQDMTDPNRLAGALAYFQRCEDVELMKELLRSVRPRAANAVGRMERAKKEPPAPLEIEAASEPLPRQEAIKVLQQVQDFAELQALSRTIGRRLEQLLMESEPG